MEKIYIGFSYPKEFKIGAAGIAMWMNRNYSHVYLRFESNKLPSNVYHAAHGMVHFREFENFKNENNIIKEYEIEVDAAKRIEILRYAIYLAGEKYGYIELGKIMCSDIVWALFKKEIHFNDARGYICSELVGAICKKELDLSFNKPLNLLKPSDIDSALESKYKRSV